MSDSSVPAAGRARPAASRGDAGAAVASRTASSAPASGGAAFDHVQAVFNAVSDAIFVADAATGLLLDANQAACDLVGLPRDQLVGRSHTDLHPPEEKALHQTLFAGCVRSVEDRPFCHLTPVTVVRADGARLASRVTVLVVPHGNGRVVYGIFQKPDDRTLLDCRLQASEAFYAQALPNTEDGVWSWNPVTNEIFVSTRWKTQLGFQAEDFTTTPVPCIERLHPEDADRVLAVLRDCSQGGQTSFAMEYRLRCKDDSYKWIHCRGAATRDVSGRVVCLAGANSDITARKEAELALRESEERFRMLARNTPDAVFLHDMEGRVMEVNARACQLLGYDEATLKQRRISDFEASCPPEALLDIWRNLQPGPFSFEGLARRRDGTTFPTEVQGVAFVERGRMLALVAARDLTARKKLESTLAEARDAAMAASRAKTDFLASMSHEIRTPMNIILGMAELLRETGVSSSQKAYLDAIENAGRVLLDLINDILDLSQIEANKIELRTEAFAPAAIIGDVCAFMGISARQKGLAFTVRLADDLPRTMRNDPARLSQVLMNLIWNAVKFTATGGIEVAAAPVADAKGRAAVRVDVADTGSGIAPEELERIFDPFTQAEQGKGRRPAGTGLGLAICRRLVTCMGGVIAAESEPGRGSVFTFTLPSLSEARPTPVRPVAVRADAPHAPPPARPRRLLLAEDSESNRELVKLFLQQEAYEIVAAETGLEAVELFTAGPFDLVLMDMEMPEMDGCEATQAIRRFETQTGAARTPILMLSAHAFSEYEEKGRQAGCDGFMSKPVRKADLVKTLREALAGVVRPVAEPA